MRPSHGPVFVRHVRLGPRRDRRGVGAAAAADGQALARCLVHEGLAELHRGRGRRGAAGGGASGLGAGSAAGARGRR